MTTSVPNAESARVVPFVGIRAVKRYVRYVWAVRSVYTNAKSRFAKNVKVEGSARMACNCLTVQSARARKHASIKKYDDTVRYAR